MSNERSPEQAAAYVTARLAISDELCASIMCTALEGGIGYWCKAGGIVRTGTRAERDAGSDWSYVSFIAHDTEADEPYTGEDASFQPSMVSYTTIRQGIEALFQPTTKVRADIRESVLRDIMSQPEIEGNIDSEAADVVVQLGLLGSIVFG